MFKAGPLAHIEFATCLDALSKCPDTYQSLFSEQYSHKLGYYNVFFYEKGYKNNIVIDDIIPID